MKSIIPKRAEGGGEGEGKARGRGEGGGGRGKEIKTEENKPRVSPMTAQRQDPVILSTPNAADISIWTPPQATTPPPPLHALIEFDCGWALLSHSAAKIKMGWSGYPKPLHEGNKPMYTSG